MKGKVGFSLAAVLSLLAALLHIAIIIGGPTWYLASGAGEQLAAMAASGSWYPTFLGSVLVFIFIAWSLYALSGAGFIARLPFLKFALVAIASVCTLRGLYGFFVPFINKSEYVASLGLSFWFFSSLVWLVLGLSYWLGITSCWADINRMHTALPK
ncbi:hypothetical protein [Agaribacterium sp. ZY112]|uniref:hypothetical protein n=1 Tax=Agaribacterium sp. ZY112 TaxID=3233574 RepID=UPI003524A1C0